MDPLTIGLTLAAKYAPDVIRYFRGDKAGDVAEKVVDIAQTVTGTNTPEAADAVLSADPAKAMEFRLAVMANETALEAMFLSDMQSARNRDVKLMDTGHVNIRANFLAALAFLIVATCLAVVVWASNMDDFAKATITLIAGRALGWVEQVFSFEFGSTRSNKAKDETNSVLAQKLKEK